MLIPFAIMKTQMVTTSIPARAKKKKNSKKHRVWNINGVKSKQICSNILFLQAILGCDTTSHLYGIGKGASLKKFNASSEFREQADVFDLQSSSVEEICTAGEKILVNLYNGKPEESLNSYSTNDSVKKWLPIHHILIPVTVIVFFFRFTNGRVLQKNLIQSNGDEKNKSEGRHIPVQTDLPSAPDELLRIIKCNCHTDCNGLKCTCKKHDMRFSTALLDSSLNQLSNLIL